MTQRRRKASVHLHEHAGHDRTIVTWQDILSCEPATGPARIGDRAESRSAATTTEPAITTQRA